MFRCAGTIRLPQKVNGAEKNPSDFEDFVTARSGKADTFLYLAVRPSNKFAVSESIGTATGAAGETFALDMKHVDSTTLKVYSAGVLQVLTTDYTFSGNNSAPLVTSTANIDAGALTATYTFYQPVRFALSDFDPRVLRRNRDADLEDQEVVEFAVALEEDAAGARYV